MLLEETQCALAIRNSELVQDRGDVRTHGSFGDEEPRGDLGRRVALPDEVEHLPLAAGQVDCASRRQLGAPTAAPVAELVDQAGDEPPRQSRLALEHGYQRARQALRVHVLEEVT